MITDAPIEENKLFPIFIKLDQLQLLIIGGGSVALERLETVLANSPATRIKIVAEHVVEEIILLQQENPTIVIAQKKYDSTDIADAQLIIIAIDDKNLSTLIKKDAAQKNILVNVADTPDLCDFYLSSIVKKGNLKIAISTNGKSPTLGKRLKETLNEVLPNEIDDVLNNLQLIRNKLKGNFAEKVSRLNEITRVLSVNEKYKLYDSKKRNLQITIWFIIAVACVVLGYILSLVVPVEQLFSQSKNFLQHIDNRFYWMIMVGFGVEMIAGSMGMGYGVICTSILLSLGLSLPIVSSSVHTSEMFGSAASSISHYQYKNVNKKLFQTLAIPGMITAILGALFLIKFGDKYAHFLKPLISFYTLYLGINILVKPFKKNNENLKKRKLKNVGWLGALGGFIDSVGGGGWGPLITSIIISKGRKPRYAIGSSIVAKFCITVTSAFTFIFVMGKDVMQWAIIFGLVVGGVTAAPFAAKLTGKLPTRGMFIAVGALVIIISTRTILKSFHLM
jgi:uncharacterized protein